MHVQHAQSVADHEDANTYLHGNTHRRRELENRAEQAERERDEALTLLATERKLGGRCQCGDDDVCRLACERDEALAEVKRLMSVAEGW